MCVVTIHLRTNTPPTRVVNDNLSIFLGNMCDWPVKSEQTAFCLLLLHSQFHLPTWLSLFIGLHHPLVASEKLLFGWLNLKVQKQLMDSSNAYNPQIVLPVQKQLMDSNNPIKFSNFLGVYTNPLTLTTCRHNSDLLTHLHRFIPYCFQSNEIVPKGRFILSAQWYASLHIHTYENHIESHGQRLL